MPECSFNNFEQGILIACAIAATLSLLWLAIIFTTACLRSIDIAHHLKRCADAAEAGATSLHKMQCSFVDLNQNVGEGFRDLRDADQS